MVEIGITNAVNGMGNQKCNNGVNRSLELRKHKTEENQNG